MHLFPPPSSLPCLLLLPIHPLSNKLANLHIHLQTPSLAPHPFNSPSSQRAHFPPYNPVCCEGCCLSPSLLLRVPPTLAPYARL